MAGGGNLSAKDDLDRFDREWDGHVRSRNQSKQRGESHYFDSNGAITRLPPSLQFAFGQKANALVEGYVDLLRARHRKELVDRAVDEARQTLEALAQEPTEPEPAPVDGLPEWPE